MKQLGIILIFLHLLAPLRCGSAVAVPTAEEGDSTGAELDLLAAPGAPSLAERLGQSSDKLQLDLFVMSLCPYGMEAQRYLLPLVERFADRVELQIHYIADEAGAEEAAGRTGEEAIPPLFLPETARRAGCAAGSDGSGTGPFRSLHGQAEVDESRRQLIALADYPAQYRAYLLCRSRQRGNDDWQACARALGIDPDSLQEAALGPRGEELFRKNIRLANALRVNLSPTLLVDGEEFTGDFAGFSLARHLCRRFPGEARCAGVPECGEDRDCEAGADQEALCEQADTPQARCVRYTPVAFSLIVLSTAACSDCSTGAFLRTTLELFPRAQVEGYVVEEPEGAALARRYGIQVFPAYIFSAAFASSPRFSRVRSMVLPVDDGFLVQPRLASVSYWTQRPLRPARLELFLPAWELGLEAQFLEGWPGDPDQVRVHHLLGPAILAEPAARPALPEELLRRVCLAAEQPGLYPAYVAARLAALRLREGTEEEALRRAGVDLTGLRACVDERRGLALLQEAQTRADSLDLEPESAAALWENRLLVRRAQPGQVAALWREGK